LLKGLSDIAKSMDEFPFLEKEFATYGSSQSSPDISLLKQKGYYPYDYVDSINKLRDNKLPDIKEFYSTLSQSTITEKRV
jgi:hypothetical protein